MWDFDMGEAFKLLLKTKSFVIFRAAIYFGISLAYVMAIGIGAGMGGLIGSIFSSSGGGAVMGGLIGFGGVTGVLFLLREYVLYIVKAGHIAVLVEAHQGNELPNGKSQIEYSKDLVKKNFKEASILFVVDQLIKGILGAINKALFSIGSLIPVLKEGGVISLVSKIIEMSLTYVDELILAYCFKMKSKNIWKSSQEGLVLYTQNYKHMLKNAMFLTFMIYAVTLVIFIVFLGPGALIASMMPGAAKGYVFLFAVLLAWSFKAAILEPLAITAMMQVYFKAIEGQTPNPEWDEKLTKISKKFGELKEKAESYVSSAIQEAPPEDKGNEADIPPASS